MTDSENKIKAKPTMFKSAMVMAIATMCSRLFGLVREQLIAAYFGASGLTDAFFVAYRIPNLFRDLFAEGAFSSAFVPNFVKARQESLESARELLWELFFILILIVGSITIGITFGAETLIDLFAPTFKEDIARFTIAVGLTKIMASFILWTSLAALMMGALNSLKVFFLPAIAPAFFNIIVILSILIFTGYLSDKGIEPVYALGLGVLLGGIGQFFIQLPAIIKNGYGFKIPKKLFSPKSIKVLMLLGPGLIGFAATQFNLIVNTVLASMSAVGAVSWLSYGFRLFQLPVGILGVSLGNSNLVYFADAWKAGDKEKANKVLSQSYHFALMLLLPVTVLTMIFARDIVSLVFQRGAFDLFSTEMTTKALRWYAFGLPCYGLYKIFVPVFYTLDKARLPVATSILGIIFNIVFCLYFTPKFGFEWLAIGTSLSMVLNVLVQSYFLKKNLNIALSFFFTFRVLKYIIASALSGAIGSYIAKSYNFIEGNLFFRLLSVSFALAFCLLCYIFVIYIFGERQVIDNLLSRLRRKGTKK